MSERVEVQFSGDELRELVVALEEVVVSLDQIGSTDGSDQDRASKVWQYFTHDRAWQTLSGARAALHNALDRTLTEPDVEAMLAGVRFWNNRN